MFRIIFILMAKILSRIPPANNHSNTKTAGCLRRIFAYSCISSRIRHPCIRFKLSSCFCIHLTRSGVHHDIVHLHSRWLNSWIYGGRKCRRFFLSSEKLHRERIKPFVICNPRLSALKFHVLSFLVGKRGSFSLVDSELLSIPFSITKISFALPHITE